MIGMASMLDNCFTVSPSGIWYSVPAYTSNNIATTEARNS